MKEKEKEKTPIKNVENISSFSGEEKKLLKKYMDEYNDMYQKILILSQPEFIEKLKKHIELSLRSKINKYSEKSKNKVQEFLIEKIYQSDYKYAQVIQKNIENRNRFEISKNYFKGEIIPHCDKDKKNGYYIHSCGEKFQTFKYKLSYDYYILHLDKESKSKDINTNHYENILFCKKCKMIYKSSLIKFKCAETSIDFYSKINLSYLDEDLPFATWAKYHCNVVINDLMKCQKCSNNLYLLRKKIKNHDKKYIFCKKCNQIWLPEQLKWECLLCKNKFSCDAKVYNPLEYKTIKICVKDALVDKIKAYPKYLECKCKIDFSKTNFFHRTSCYGELFFGELNNKKTVICSKCDSIGFYDEYVWTCPICFKKTKTEKIIDEKLENFENKSAIHSRDKKKNENINDEDKNKDKDKEKNKDSVSVSKINNDKSMGEKKLFNLFQNIKKLNEDDRDIVDLKNNINTKNYLRNKSINNFLFKEKDKEKENNDSIEKRKINYSIKDSEKSNCKTIEKETSKSDIENENVNANSNERKNFNLIKNSKYLRNNKEEYFNNYKKKYITNISIKTKIKTDYNDNGDKNIKSNNKNDNLSSKKIINNNFKNILSANRYSGKKDDNKNKNFNKDKIINTEENRVLKPKKSLSIIDFGYSNIKDIESILNKFEKKININLNYKPLGVTGINFHRPLSKQIVNKPYSTIENKDKDIFASKNKTAIDDLKTEESPLNSKNEIFGEKITRKESFMSKYNKLKNSKNYSRISSSKKILNENENDISQNKNIVKDNENNNINKNMLLKSVNVNKDYYKTEINKNEGKKDENISYFKKSKIFQRYRNLKNNNNLKNENKSMQRIKINNDLINKNNNNDEDKYDNKNNRKDSINDKYYIENYNNKKGSNSTADDSDQTTKIIYHAKNPRQSFQIRKSNTNVNRYYNNFNINDYTIIKKIGQGSFGQIFLIEDKYKNKYAMKKIIAIAEKDIKKIEHEYQILIDLSRQNEKDNNNSTLNLVKIYGYSSKQLDPTTYVIYVLMELAITDWEKEILSRQKRREYYTEKELMTILYSLINTFAELQKKNISHRDIKPQNILLFKDNKYKLADFGEAKELYKDLAPTNKQTLRGTELYMAPTLFQALQSKKIIKYINHNPYKSDVFSFGLCSLLAASLCFESIYDIRELNNNVSIRVILEKYLHKNYSFDVINIISQMLDINETTRKDFIEMKNEFETIGYK